MNFEIKNNVHWVGKIDWELRKFHGEEYSTHRGTSYNSYLIKDTHTALIDTVWTPFRKEFVDGLSDAVSLDEIDFIIANQYSIRFTARGAIFIIVNFLKKLALIEFQRTKHVTGDF